MNNIQKDWILEKFFKNEEFLGWKNIADKLIDTGSCVTTIQGKDIWVGDIGNFIGKEPYNDGVDLIKLTFNPKEFCSFENKFFVEHYKRELLKLKDEQKVLTHTINSMEDLVKNKKL